MDVPFQGRAVGDPAADTLTQQINALPEVQGILQRWDAFSSTQPAQDHQRILAIAQQHGLSIPDGYEYKVAPTRDAQGHHTVTAGVQKTPSLWEAIAPALGIFGAVTGAGVLASGGLGAASGLNADGTLASHVIAPTSAALPAGTNGASLAALGGGASALSSLPAALKALVPLAGLVGGHAIAGNQSNQNVPPQLNDLLAQALARIKYQNPLFQAATQQAFGGLPTYAQHGITPPTGSL